ncbi:MAG: DUF4007 family protein [Methylococcales bacterium]|nr:DUF4007 family protein [Methylococcales bacterium]MCK5925003.1 DUF4007 family protein [Methylococcales bacterium]
MESLIIPFNDKKATFGRHETFALRYSWLTKGFNEVTKNSDIFLSDEATVELGVGKNMVNAIKHWLLAAKMLKPLDGRGHQTTPLAQAIFSKPEFDPYLEDEATLWLIHWLLATNAESATAWYWFFNYYHKPEFNLDEVKLTLADFVKNKLSGTHSEKTVKKEIDLILKMYVQSNSSKKSFDEILDTPLSNLNLIEFIPSKGKYRSQASSRTNIPIDIIGFAVNEIFNQLESDQLPIETLMYSHKQNTAIASVFRLTESSLLTKLELLVQKYPNDYRIDEIAGIHQFTRLNKIEPLDILKNYYADRKSADRI